MSSSDQEFTRTSPFDQGIPVTIVAPHHLLDGEAEVLENQGVSLDDWDYMILCSPSLIEVYEECDEYEGGVITKYRPVAGTVLDRLLTGSYDNYWYKATTRGKCYAIGIAYHG